MHDKFEKEVQRKMEELQLKPSAPVWEKIELEITPEKKRRRLILWFFLGAFLLATGLFIFQPWHKEPAKIAVQQTPIETRQLEEKQVSPKENDKELPTETIANSSKNSSIEEVTAEKVTASQNKISRRELSHRQRNGNNKRNTSGKEVVLYGERSANKPLASDEPNPVIDGNQKSKNERNLPVKEKSILPKISMTDIDTLTVKPDFNKTDSIAKPQPEKTENLPPTADSVVKKKVASKSPWQKRINFSVGKTGFASISALKSATFDQQYQSPGSAPQLGNAISSPAETNAGLGFSLGVSFAKKLNEDLELAIGAQYAYYSTNTAVGTQRRNDTTVVFNSGSMSTGRYYTNTQAENYTNQFHVIELPVTLSYKPSIKLPIYVAVGAAYGRLISTNALTYSLASNVYYENKENYLRNSLPVFSSVQVGLFEKKKVSLRIGPALQYNLLKQQKEQTSNSGHLFFAGLKGQINF